MSISERAPKIPDSALLDFRRRQNKTEEIPGIYQYVITLDDYRARPEEVRRILERANVIAGAGGDGTFGLALDFAIRGSGVLVAYRQGTTNTLYDALVTRFHDSPITEDLAEMFSPDRYEARRYHPPFAVIGDSQRRSFAYAYLWGVDHLTVHTNILFERIRNSGGNVHTLYTRAGVKSALILWNRRFKPLKPKNLGHRVESQPRESQDDRSDLGLAAIAVPILGTFSFQNDIDERKLRLLTLSGRDNLALRARYSLALMVGAMLGVDRVLKWKIAEANDVDSVTFQPDLCHSDEPNVSIDGELRRIEETVLLTRSLREVTVILPRKFP